MHSFVSGELGRGIVDVIVPLYNNVEDARRLFVSLVSASIETKFRLVVIDDASTQAATSILPQENRSLVEAIYIRNETNLGFAASVNKGLRLSQRDVAILNTDTLVFDGWIDRLREASVSRSRVSTVTPLSNAATILSYPTFPEEFRSELEVSWGAFAKICASQTALPVAIPTGVGFCMFITRACINEIGMFDEASFSAGYGEECDFCRRAVSAGWTNLVAPNVFVWHRGEGSFGDRAAALREKAQLTLRERHPDYPSVVAAFIRSDPLLPVRRTLDVLRIKSAPGPGRLHLRIGQPNGSSSGRKEMFFVREGQLWPRFRPRIAGCECLPNLPWFSPFTRSATIEQFLAVTEVPALVAYPSRIWSNRLFRRFRQAAVRLGLPIEYVTG